MAIVPGTNVIARELTVAVPGSVGLEDGGDGLGQLIHLSLVPGGLRAVRSAHRMTAAPDGRAEPSVVAAVPGALRWRGLGGRGTRAGRDCQGWRELSGRKVRRAYRVNHPACQPGVLRTGSPANTTKSSPPHATGEKASRVHPYTALPHVAPGHFSLLTRHDDMSLCIVRFVRGGDHRAVRARPAGPARLREAINPRLEETSSGTALAACVAALLLIVAAVAVALLVSGHGTAGGQGTAADAAPSDPAGTAGTPVAMPAAPPRPRATAVPSASPATPDQAASSPAASSPAANPTASATKPAPSATSSPPRCPPGHARHHRC